MARDLYTYCHFFVSEQTLAGLIFSKENLQFQMHQPIRERLMVGPEDFENEPSNVFRPSKKFSSETRLTKVFQKNLQHLFNPEMVKMNQFNESLFCDERRGDESTSVLPGSS